MQGQVNVVPARWWHVRGLSRLIRETRRRPSAGGAILWAPHWSPTLGLLQSVWTPPVPGMEGPRSLVVEANGRPIGVAQMRPRGEPHQWEVVYLAIEPLAGPLGASRGAGGWTDGAPAPLLFAPDRRATRLLGDLCDAGVALGAERIFAGIVEDGGRYEVFKQVGFAPVAREYDFLSPAGLEPGGTPAGAFRVKHTAGRVPGLRPQQRADAFGLLQLYQSSTPKLVQLAEGKRSRSWDVPDRGPLRRLIGRRAEARWVVEREGRNVAWLQLRRAGHNAGAALAAELLVDPRAPDVVDPLVELCLAAAGEQPGAGVLVHVQEHQQALIASLEGHGFVPVESRLLMVKQLAAAIRVPQLVPALEKAV